MRKTADAVTQCKFESTDPASDDTVLCKILQVDGPQAWGHEPNIGLDIWHLAFLLLRRDQEWNSGSCTVNLGRKKVLHMCTVERILSFLEGSQEVCGTTCSKAVRPPKQAWVSCTLTCVSLQVLLSLVKCPGGKSLTDMNLIDIFQACFKIGHFTGNAQKEITGKVPDLHLPDLFPCREHCLFWEGRGAS